MRPAEVIDVQQSTISRVVYRYQRTGQVSIRPDQCRRKVTSELDDCYLRLTGLRIRHTSARKQQAELLAALNFRISLQIVTNRLREVGIKEKVTARGSQYND